MADLSPVAMFSLGGCLVRGAAGCAGIRYIQENDYPVRGTWGLT